MISIGHCKTLEDAKREALEYCGHVRQPNNHGSRKATYCVAEAGGGFFLVRMDQPKQQLPATWQPSDAEINDYASQRPPLCLPTSPATSESTNQDPPSEQRP